MTSDIARDISYAHSAASRSGRILIRAVENATGRVKLIRRAAGYEQDVNDGHDFWQVMVDRFGLSLDVTQGSLDFIPRTGPVVIVANHPYGILDGLMLGHVLAYTRGDFRILAHQVFRKAEDINRVILPIDFAQTKEAMRLNLQTRKTALSYLAQGGAIGVFPGGTVSTAATPFSQPMDPKWRRFTAKMVAKSGATVVPIHFHGQTSRLFQLASHLHITLRMALLINEFRARVDTPVRVAIGQPIRPETLTQYAADPKSMMDFLREQTYALSDNPKRHVGYGYEFEDKHRG